MIRTAPGHYRRLRDSMRGGAAFDASEKLSFARRREPNRAICRTFARMKPTPPFPPEVLDALRRGRTFDAIKLLRKSGFGLAEAKSLLEWHARQNTIPTRARPPAGSDAPEATPRPMAHPHPPTATRASIARGLSPGEVPRGGGNGLGVGVLLVVGILAALYFLGAD